MEKEIKKSKSGEANTFFRFREFPVYKESRQFRQQVKQLSKDNFPKEENYILRQQLWRALDSILLNIAEGSDKHSDIDFSRFLNTAVGSVDEAVACLDGAFDDGYITEEDYKNYSNHAEKIIRQLKAFLAKVRKD